MTTLIRFDPFRDLYDLDRDMARIFGRTAREFRRSLTESGARAVVPAIDVFAKDKDLVLRAELPGLTEKDVEIAVDGRTLTVRGERREEHEVSESDFYRREMSYGRFERSIELPDGVDVDKIHATLEDGVLEVTIPRAAELSGSKKVPIEVGSKRKALTARVKKAA